MKVVSETRIEVVSETRIGVRSETGHQVPSAIPGKAVVPETSRVAFR